MIASAITNMSASDFPQPAWLACAETVRSGRD
jgi:hypothetical protein